jgi:hypothetical protein
MEHMFCIQISELFHPSPELIKMDTLILGAGHFLSSPPHPPPLCGAGDCTQGLGHAKCTLSLHARPTLEALSSQV